MRNFQEVYSTARINPGKPDVWTGICSLSRCAQSWSDPQVARLILGWFPTVVGWSATVETREFFWTVLEIFCKFLSSISPEEAFWAAGKASKCLHFRAQMAVPCQWFAFCYNQSWLSHAERSLKAASEVQDLKEASATNNPSLPATESRSLESSFPDQQSQE